MSSHKPGSLKQSNKKHKGANGKRALNRSFGEGRISSSSQKTSVKNHTSNPVNERQNRINRNNQVKKNKGANSWLQKRIGSTSGGPKLVGIIPLSDSARTEECLEHCLHQSDWTANNQLLQSSTVIQAHFAQFKTRCTFLKAPVGEERNLLAIVDIAKVADIIVFVLDARSGDASSMIDQRAQSMISALKALGCPEAVFCVLGLDNSTSKTNVALRKTTTQSIERLAAFPGAKILEAGTVVGGNATAQLVRALCNVTPKAISWRTSRSMMVTDSVRVYPQQQEESGSVEPKLGVVVSGYLRGAPMNVNSLMHILGVGACRLVCAWEAAPGEERQHSSGGAMVGEATAASAPANALYADSSKQDSLVMSAVADSIAGEQTWPTEAEYLETMDAPDSNAGRSRRTVGGAGTVIPLGMSSYQADWFQDEQGRIDFTGKVLQPGDDEMGGGDDASEEGDAEAMGEVQDDRDGDSIAGGEDDEGMSVAGGGAGLRGDQAANKQRLRGALAADDLEFPDEMQTPSDMAARARFARYRALQSFRASPWHPKENLPQDYARIFEFENFGGTQRRILSDCRVVEQLQDSSTLHSRGSKNRAHSGGKSVVPADEDQAAMDLGEGEDEEDGESVDMAEERSGHKLLVPGTDEYIRSGQYIHLQLADIHADVALRLQTCGYLALFGLHQHEQKTSVLHFNVQRTADNSDLIRSKDELLFQAGFRSFVARPVFSESNLNCDKHKFERFLLHDRFSMASCFGPVTYSPSPLLVFKRSAATGQFDELVATGSLNKVDPDRIMLKKIILTGIPIRVRKKYAVVKHMFYEPQDVRWFKPAELVSKHGLRGHIKEPIGTHGLLKAYFSGPIKQNDTVMLILYKRVYPKFPSIGLVVK